MNLKITKHKIFSWTSILILCLFLTACSTFSPDNPQPPAAVKGEIDLRNWDFENGAVNLSGEWAFYWEELLQPGQFSEQDPTLYVKVPDIWTNYELSETTLSPEGYATYRLVLYPPETEQVYGIYIEGEGSAYSLWADGQLIARNGQVGSSPESMIPEKKPFTVFFEPQGNTVELVMQISNFQHRKSGFRNTILLGLAEPVHRFQMHNWFIEAVSIGILFVMGLYHLFLYFFRTKNKAPLYFGLLCWLSAVRTGVTNQNTLLFQMPFITWDLALKLEYLVFFLVPVLFVLFLRILYPEDIHRWFIGLVIGCGTGFSLFLLCCSTLTFSYSVTYYQIIYLFEILYYVYFLGRIIYKRRTGAFYIGLASLITFASVIIETLSLQKVIETVQIPNAVPIGSISTFGFLAFIFVQAILLANLFSKSFTRVESLSVELEKANISLEQSERKYRILFEDSKDMIFIASPDGQIQEVSPACEEVLGYSRYDLIQMTLYDVIFNQADSDLFRNAIIAQGTVNNLESDLLRKDGRVIHTLVSAVSRLDENNKIIGVQGSVRDITARKQAETERLRAVKLEQIAITDPLTKIYNRRFFDQVSVKEIERAKRNGSSLALIMFDIDHFKVVNDSFGHLTGDDVLVKLAKMCQENLRSMDIFARLGGEEFVILMPDTDRRSAQEAAERFRQMVAQELFVVFEEMDVKITISTGISVWDPGKPIDFNTLLDRADQALYQSKKAGRNRVTFWENTAFLKGNGFCHKYGMK